MGKIRDWLIHLLGGGTKDEFDTAMAVNYILAKQLNEEKIAKQHVIDEARGWKKQWREVSALYKAELNQPNKCIAENIVLKQRNSELQTKLYKLESNTETLEKVIYDVEGVPEELLKRSICNNFMDKLYEYVKIKKFEEVSPATCKTFEHLVATLKVVKPYE